VAVLVLATLGWIGFLPKAEIRGPVEIVDGDSFNLSGERIRLYAIDAPELGQPCRDGSACGARARDHLAQLVAGRMLVCEKRDTDRYGRDVAQCFIDEAPTAGKPVKGEDIGRAMVRDGQAMAYRKTAQLYVSDEPPRFDFDPPWDWRERHPPR
jgi:endonuclease YncB( thermonuclease family)